VEPVVQQPYLVLPQEAEAAVVVLLQSTLQVPLDEFVLFFTDKDFFTDKYQDKKNDRIPQFCRSV
jgi:hypothetical protein